MIEFTELEKNILILICQGYSPETISQRLASISAKGVNRCKQKLLVKTGSKNTVALVIYAIKNKIVDPDDIKLLS